MGLEDEFGLFKRTNGNGRLFKNGTGVGIISGKSRKGIKLGFITTPIKAEIRKRVKKGVKGVFERPRRLTTEEILEKEQKGILKKLRVKERGKKRQKEIRRLEKKFGEMI